MKKLIALGIGISLVMGLSGCKDEVYIPFEENNIVMEVVKVVFDPTIVFPGANGNPTVDDGNEDYNPDTGDRYIYLFPDDNLNFDMAGLDKAGISRLEVLVNDNLVDVLEGEDIPETLHFDIDPRYFRSGRNEMLLRYTFPNGEVVTRTYYFVVFSEHPRMALKYDFTSDISIIDSSGQESPSSIEVTSTNPDGRIDYATQTFYMHAGDEKIVSSLSTNTDGIYGDTWRFDLRVDCAIDTENSNVIPDKYDISYDWDRGACSESTYTVLAPRTSAIDLDWANAFQKEIHTVNITGTCEGYMQEDGQNYYYRAEVNDTYYIVPRLQSSLPVE